MRIAHLADVHLGYRAYNRVTRQGLNVREADAFNAFRQALDKVAEIQPDIVIVAGDLFHVVRPSNLCIEHTFRAFAGLRAKIAAPIVLIGGNHDSPRSADTGCILDLLQNLPGISVVHNEYRGVVLPEINTTVFCLCHRALPTLSDLKIEPNPETRYNILTIHGTLEGIGRNLYDTQEPITRSKVIHDGWDYIALGHYHRHEKLADNAYYAGSLEFTSFNIWEETDQPKGFIEFDVEDRLATFHKVKAREVIDLRPVDAEGRSAAELDELIRLRVNGIKGGHEDKIVRLLVENVPRPIIPDLDYKAIRQIRGEALHFDIQFRPKREGISRVENESRVGLPLEEEWREFVKSYDIPAGVDREELITRGLNYLAVPE